MKIKIRPVRTYEVFGGDGTPIGLFSVTSQWEGLVKLQSVATGKDIVIGAPDREGTLDDVLSALFSGTSIQEYLTVISASPDLSLRLAKLPDPH